MPIEVKSARSYSTVSLDKFRGKYAQLLSTPYVLHTKNIEVKNGAVYLPLYMTPLVATGVEDSQATKRRDAVFANANNICVFTKAVFVNG